jgi:pyridoxamine 5'-phosphate oxidase
MEVNVGKNNSPTPDPITLFLKWYEEAQTGKGGLSQKKRIISFGLRLIRRLIAAVLPWSNLFRPDIATLATTTPENRPAARSVLFKGLVHGGFSFYTDYESHKGRELDVNPSAVLVFYWHLPPRQVRIDGKVVKLSREKAEADWKVRRRENQAASAAATQSSIIRGREELVEKVERIKRQYKGRPIPCPDSWGGYYLVPEKMEFWQGRLDWIHQRERYALNNGTWERVFLAP